MVRFKATIYVKKAPVYLPGLVKCYISTGKNVSQFIA